MKRAMLLISLVSLMAMSAGCGGSTGGSGSSLVTVTVGGNGNNAGISVEKNTLLARALFSAKKLFASAGSAYAAIPSSVTEITFTITGPEPGFQTISSRVNVTPGQPDITEQFDVPNGNGRHFAVTANNSSGQPLYRGESYLDLAGVPVSVNIQMNAILAIEFGDWGEGATHCHNFIDPELGYQYTSVIGYIMNTGSEPINGITCTTNLTGLSLSSTASLDPSDFGDYYGNTALSSIPANVTVTCSGTGTSGAAVSNSTTITCN